MKLESAATCFSTETTWLQIILALQNYNLYLDLAFLANTWQILQKSAKEIGTYLFIVPIKRQECAAVSTFPVKKQEMNSWEQCPYTGSSEKCWKLLREHCRRWIKSPDSGEGITVPCKHRKPNNKMWPHSSCELSEAAAGIRSSEGFGQEVISLCATVSVNAFSQPCKNLGEMNTQGFVCTISNLKKKKQP